MKSLKSAYKGQRVLVTGHTGFKGAWLSEILIDIGAKVYGYSLNPNTDPNLYSVLNLHNRMKETIADIRDIHEFNQVVRTFKPNIIFHLAAQPLVRDSYDQPRYTYETNVVGTVNVLEVVRLNKVPAAVIITTDKVYRNLEKDIAYKETDPLGGYDPYSNSKACADLVVSSYIQSFFNPKDFNIKHNTLIASARSGNVIGGGDWARDRLIPDAIRAFLSDSVELIIRSPQAIRPWQHVLEPLDGYLRLGSVLLTKNKKCSGAWNFGPAESDMQNVKTVLALLIAQLNQGKYRIEPDHNKHEAGNLKLDNAKARINLKWNPRFNLEDAIKATADWYREYYRGEKDMQKVTLGQINSFYKR